MTIGIIFTDYVKQLGTILADASVPNPGHSLSEIEGWETLVKTSGNQTIAGVKNFSGNVGIGTATPGAKLTIADNGSPAGARLLDIGDDTYLTDIDLANTLGIYGIQDITRSRLKLGSTGGIISGYNNNIGINQALPAYRLDVNGTGRFTGAVIVGDPTSSSHAATKEYVDNHSGGLPTGGTDGAFLRMTSNGPIWDTLLTWIGSTHTVYDCVKIGGTVFDTGTTGTICRLPSETVPSGWRQAGDWSTTVIPTSCTCTGSNCCSGTYTARYICGSFYAGPSSGHQWSNMPIEPEIQRLGTPGGDCFFADCCCCDVYRTILELGIY